MKNLIFDYDGTLVDSLPQIADVLNETLTFYKLKPVSFKHISSFIGDGSLMLVIRAVNKSVSLSNKEIAVIHDLYLENYNKVSNEKVVPYEGITEVLNELKNRGVTVSVVSNKPQKNVESGLAELFPNFKFDVIVGGGNQQNLPLKPNPAMVNYVIEKLGANKAETAYVGDSEVDIQVAKNAGVKGFSVLWGYRNGEELADAGGRNFIEFPRDIMEIFE